VGGDGLFGKKRLGGEKGSGLGSLGDGWLEGEGCTTCLVAVTSCESGPCRYRCWSAVAITWKKRSFGGVGGRAGWDKVERVWGGLCGGKFLLKRGWRLGAGVIRGSGRGGDREGAGKEDIYNNNRE